MPKEKELEKKGGSFGILLKGLLLGGIIGATAALLSAPKSGQMMRNDIREKSIDLRDRAMNTVEDTRSRAESLTRQGTDRANDIASKGQSVVNEQRANLIGVVEGVKEGVRTYKE